MPFLAPIGAAIGGALGGAAGVIAAAGVVVSLAGTIASQVIAGNERKKAQLAAERAAAAQLAQIQLEENAAILDEKRRARKLSGAQKAAFGRSGVELTGSPLDVMLEAESLFASNVSRITQAADSERALVRAGLLNTSGSINAQATGAFAAGVSQLGGTLLTGAQFFSRNVGRTSTVEPTPPLPVHPSGTVVRNGTIRT